MVGMRDLVQKPTGFVVDDDDSVGKSLSRLLVLEGYNVQYFPSGRNFLDSVPTDADGCLVSDIYMPEIDGFMLQQKLNHLGYRLPVIFISAHAKAGDREYALDRGAAGFLIKPFDEQSLIDLLHKTFLKQE